MNKKKKLKISKLFMNIGDKKALQELYNETKDNLVKIILQWHKEFPEIINECNTYANSMYEDIVDYIYDKYKLG